MIADRGDALCTPTRRHVPRMEEERVAHGRCLETLVDDLGDRNSGLPLLVGLRDARQRTPVNEGELPALEQHAAVAVGKAPAALRTVGDHLANGELTGKGLTLGFEID